MTFRDYYNSSFRDDLRDVVRGLAPVHDHGEFSLQPRSISVRNPTVRSWDEHRRMAFAVALFLTVLADQVCYTHFRSSYPQFRDLTQYPKWRGDCPGACHNHIHPGAVFRAIGSEEGRLGSISDLPFAEMPDEVLATMESEVTDFVRRYLPSVDAEDFWNRCDREVPLEFRFGYLRSREQGRAS